MNDKKRRNGKTVAVKSQQINVFEKLKVKDLLFITETWETCIRFKKFTVYLNSAP